MWSIAYLLTIQRNSAAIPRLEGLSVESQNRVLDLIPLFPLDGAERAH